MRATREQIAELAKAISIQSYAIETLSLTKILDDQELYAKAKLLAANATTLLVWTEEEL